MNRAVFEGALACCLGAAAVFAAQGARAMPSELRLTAIGVEASPGSLPEPMSPKKQGAHEDVQAVTRHFGPTFVNLHTHEVLPARLGPDPFDDAAVSRFLRCRVTHDMRSMARPPLDVALALAERFDASRVMVVSGYRSVRFNELLRKKGHEVAARSRHTLGQALDFRLQGVSAVEMAAAAEEIHSGGVGTYPISGFIHVDVGPDRRWRGR